MTSRRDLVTAGILGLLLFLLYRPWGDFGWYADVLPNLQIAESILQEGDLFLSSREIPELLHWRQQGSNGSALVRLDAYDDVIDQLVREGRISVDGMDVVVRPTATPDQYMNIFGSGVGIAITPLWVIGRLIVGPENWHTGTMWQAGKIASCLFAAGSVVFIFGCARCLVGYAEALVTALLYGLATNLFGTSSQTLMQHPVNQFFLSAGLFFYLRSSGRSLDLFASGLALTAAVWCRPTSAIVVMAIAGTLLWNSRRDFVAFAVGALPPGLLFLVHNSMMTGSPFRVGQGELTNVALEVTGSTEIFQTPLWFGCVAQFFSPSRGLFIFSPFLVAALPGLVSVWRKEPFARLRPIAAALIVIWIIEFKHFDWWGGWSYGYRHLVDTTTLLILFLLPALPSLVRWRWSGLLFGIAVAWSISVQYLGASAFDVCGWNNRQAERIVQANGETTLRLLDDYRTDRVPDPTGRFLSLNVDDPANRHRLWSWTDWQIWYYWRNGSASRRTLREFCDELRSNPIERRARSHFRLIENWLSLGEPALARRSLDVVAQLVPDDPKVRLLQEVLNGKDVGSDHSAAILR